MPLLWKQSNIIPEQLDLVRFKESTSIKPYENQCCYTNRSEEKRFKTVTTIQVVVSTPGSLVAIRDSSFVEAVKIIHNDQVDKGSKALHLVILVFVLSSPQLEEDFKVQRVYLSGIKSSLSSLNKL